VYRVLSAAGLVALGIAVLLALELSCGSSSRGSELLGDVGEVGDVQYPEGLTILLSAREPLLRLQ
jgi:hypothetical protein